MATVNIARNVFIVPPTRSAARGACNQKAQPVSILRPGSGKQGVARGRALVAAGSRKVSGIPTFSRPPPRGASRPGTRLRSGVGLAAALARMKQITAPIAVMRDPAESGRGDGQRQDVPEEDM